MKFKSADPSAIQHKSFDFEVKEILPSGAFTGYGSVFGTLDQGNEIVVKGAFAESLEAMKAKGRKFPILWQHRSGEPLGAYDAVKEDDHGLLMDGTLLVNDVQRAKEAHALMKAGAVNGMSIGYNTIEEKYDSKTSITQLLKLKLRETSIVTFPMHDDARVTTVKTLDQLVKSGKLPTLSEFEDFLCEAGFSRTQAKAVAGNGLRKLLQCEAEVKTVSDTIELLKSFSLNNPAS